VLSHNGTFLLLPHPGRSTGTRSQDDKIFAQETRSKDNWNSCFVVIDIVIIHGSICLGFHQILLLPPHTSDYGTIELLGELAPLKLENFRTIG
jgi:hypothetical protein